MLIFVTSTCFRFDFLSAKSYKGSLRLSSSTWASECVVRGRFLCHESNSPTLPERDRVRKTHGSVRTKTHPYVHGWEK